MCNASLPVRRPLSFLRRGNGPVGSENRIRSSAVLGSFGKVETKGVRSNILMHGPKVGKASREGGCSCTMAKRKERGRNVPEP